MSYGFCGLRVVVRSALEVELQGVMQAAALDHIRDFCIQLDRHAKSRQEALRSLHNQWQSILDFRELVVRRHNEMCENRWISMQDSFKSFTTSVSLVKSNTNTFP